MTVEEVAAAVRQHEVRSRVVLADLEDPDACARLVASAWNDRVAEATTEAGNELRVAPALYPLWDRVIATTLDFSGIRLRNATRA